MAQYKTFKTMAQDESAPPPESLGVVPQITSMQERQSLIKNNKVVVIDNYTTWCGPCKQCAPRFAQLAKTYGRPGLCAFAKENVEDKCGGWPVQIRGVPCFHFYVNGQFMNDMTVTGADVDQVGQHLKNILA